MIIKTRKDRKIANQKAMIQNRDILIKDLMKIKTELKEENLTVHNENKELRTEIDVIRDCLNEIEKELNKQQYNNIENLKNKIKSILKTAKSF
jgi:phage-related minor tail protein